MTDPAPEPDATRRVRVRVPVPLGQIEDVFYLAICRDCQVRADAAVIPFDTAAKRDEWATAHATTGHRVDREIELRGVASA
jgi:hypothetical protein